MTVVVVIGLVKMGLWVILQLLKRLARWLPLYHLLLRMLWDGKSRGWFDITLPPEKSLLLVQFTDDVCCTS